MKALTLTELNKALQSQRLVMKFPEQYVELQLARDYLLGVSTEQPQDPREVLTAIGWQW